MVKNYHNSDVNKMNKIRQAGYRWSVHPRHGLSFLCIPVREYESSLRLNVSVDGPNIWNFYIFDRPLFDFRTTHYNFKSFGPSSLNMTVRFQSLTVVKSVLFFLMHRPLWPLNPLDSKMSFFIKNVLFSTKKRTMRISYLFFSML